MHPSHFFILLVVMILGFDHTYRKIDKNIERIDKKIKKANELFMEKK